MTGDQETGADRDLPGAFGAMSDTTRVTFVIPSLGAGGAERSLEVSLPGLVERGIEPRVVVFHRRAQGSHAVVERSGVQVHVVEGSRLRRVVELRRVLLAEPTDLVHTSVVAADIAGRLAARAAGLASVGTLVNTTYELSRLDDPNVSRPALEVNRAVDATTARLSVGFRAITEAVKESAVRRMRLDPDRIEVIPRGRVLGRFAVTSDDRARVRERFGVDDDVLVVGNVARHEHQKGLDLLVEALAELVLRDRQVLLVQAGRDGNASDELRRRIARLGMDSHVELLGHVDDVAADVLPGLDVFAFPSRYEGLGGALIEAMAAGLPIVTSDLPVTREVTDGSAVLVPVGDVEALADGIERAPGATDRATTIDRAGRFALDDVLDREAAWLRRCADSARR
ncbi:MAG: glycosyltransferase [Actinomycetota bacterium]